MKLPCCAKLNECVAICPHAHQLPTHSPSRSGYAFDTVKVRLQNSPVDTYKSAWQCFTRILRYEGVRLRLAVLDSSLWQTCAPQGYMKVTIRAFRCSPSACTEAWRRRSWAARWRRVSATQCTHTCSSAWACAPVHFFPLSLATLLKHIVEDVEAQHLSTEG